MLSWINAVSSLRKISEIFSQLNTINYRPQLNYNPPYANISQPYMYVSTSAEENIGGTYIPVQLPEELCTLAANLSGLLNLYSYG